LARLEDVAVFVDLHQPISDPFERGDGAEDVRRDDRERAGARDVFLVVAVKRHPRGRAPQARR
jgi:hypothetical protein